MSRADLPPLSAGDEVELLRAGERTALASMTVRSVDGLSVALDGRSPVGDGPLTVRWWDDRDVAWEARASVVDSEPASGGLTVRIIEWQPAVLRRAARVEIGRAPVELVTLGGDGRVVRRVGVICLDLSATGCRVTGSGAAPARGDVIQVAATTSELSICVDARFVHVASAAFGGWHAGLEFLPRTADERALLAAWRDGAARR